MPIYEAGLTIFLLDATYLRRAQCHEPRWTIYGVIGPPELVAHIDSVRIHDDLGLRERSLADG